jgi:hypothetical protein
LNWIIELEKNPDARYLVYRSRNASQNQPSADLSFQLGPGGPYLRNGSIYALDVQKCLPIFTHRVPCPGMILADDTGSGKTVTVLALVDANPFLSIRDMPWDNNFCFMALPSRATLVVCPAQLTVQWHQEAMRCIPGVRVHVLATIMDHKKLTWDDVLTSKKFQFNKIRKFARDELYSNVV